MLSLRRLSTKICDVTVRIRKRQFTETDGDSKTRVIDHLSPDMAYCNESASSISFAEKIGQVQTKLRRDSAIRKSGHGLKKAVDDKLSSPRK
nr:C. briggsae CBR-KLP-3 protein [Haemonchus contortus]